MSELVHGLGDKDLSLRRKDSARFRAEEPDGCKRPLENL